MNKAKLWKHQEEAINIAATRNEYGLFFEPGTGKTRTMLHILNNLYKKHGKLRTLILAPVVVLQNWQREWAMWMPHATEDSVMVLDGSIKKRSSAVLYNRANKPIITNYEGLGVSQGSLTKAILEWAPQVVVCDESHKIKTHNAVRTKRVIEIGDQAEYRYILTGSPVLNSPMDLWGQFRFLDKGASFSKEYFKFRKIYFVDKNFGMPRDRYYPNYVVRPQALKEMNQIVSSKTLVVRKHECLDLPPLVKQTYLVDLSPEQAKVYNDMKKNFITYFHDKASTADNVLTKALRLLQIASGFVKTEEGEEIIFDDNPKINALEELLETITPQHKVIIWCVYKRNYSAITKLCDKLKIKYRIATGEQSAEEKNEAVNWFNNDTTTRVFIGNPSAVGIGINLIVASYSIYYSRNFNLESDIQSEARNYRAGSEMHTVINRIDLVAKGTIDQKVSEALANKEDVSNKILSGDLNGI